MRENEFYLRCVNYGKRLGHKEKGFLSQYCYSYLIDFVYPDHEIRKIAIVN